MASVSASLVLKTTKGFVLCSETRRDSSSETPVYVLQSHIIGGKCNPGENTVFTACREFMEETYPVLKMKSFKDKNTYKKIFEKLIISKKDQIILKQSEKHTNPLYIVDIEQFNTENPNDLLVYNHLFNIVEEFKEKGKVLNLFYWNINEDFVNPVSYLLQLFVNEIIKKECVDDSEICSVHSGVDEGHEFEITHSKVSSNVDVVSKIPEIIEQIESSPVEEDEFDLDDF